MRWPWKPREYVAVVAALRATEEALARRQAEASKQRQVQTSVRQELSRRKAKR